MKGLKVKTQKIVKTDSKAGYAVIPVSKLAYYIDEYVNLRKSDKLKKVALEASDNGRCWWIFQFLMYY